MKLGAHVRLLAARPEWFVLCCVHCHRRQEIFAPDGLKPKDMLSYVRWWVRAHRHAEAQ